MAQKDTFHSEVAEESECIMVWIFHTIDAALSDIAVFRQQFVKTVRYPLVFPADISLLHSRMRLPLIPVIKARLACPVPGEPVPCDRTPVSHIGTFDGGRKFAEPLVGGSGAVHLLQRAGRGGLGASKRRHIEVFDIHFAESLSQQPGFPPALFGQSIVFIIGIAMSYDQ